MARPLKAGVRRTERPQITAQRLPFSRSAEFCYASGSHWFAVYTNIRSENRAQAGLDAKGYRTYQPQMTRWIRHARTRQIVKRPLLTRYFFVEVNPAKQSFEDIRQTDGIERMIGTAGVPMVIPRGFVEAFLQKQLAGEFDYAKAEPMIEGAKIKIVSGEWDDAIGVIISGFAHEDAGAVMVRILGEKAQVRLRAYSVRAAVI